MRKILIVLSILSLLLCFSTTAMADLVLADGEASGQWFNSERGGEGGVGEFCTAAWSATPE